MRKNAQKCAKMRKKVLKKRKKTQKSTTFERFLTTTCVSVRAGFVARFSSLSDSRKEKNLPQSLYVDVKLGKKNYEVLEVFRWRRIG